MRTLIILCIASFLFQGCIKKDKYYDLDGSKKIIFSQGDTLVYNSNHEKHCPVQDSEDLGRTVS